MAGRPRIVRFKAWHAATEFFRVPWAFVVQPSLGNPLNAEAIGAQQTKKAERQHSAQRAAETDTPEISSDEALAEQPSESKLVTWEGADDPDRPINWSFRRRWTISLAMMSFSFVNTFTSSVWAPAVPSAAEHFDKPPEVLRLGVSLFVLGSCAGPLLWAPLSELTGRTQPLFIGMFVSAIFNIPVAVASNVQTILVCRFLGGVFGCAGLTIAPAVAVDTLPPLERGVSVVLLVGCMLIAPCLGPIFGALVAQGGNWRWVGWLAFIVEVVALLFGFIVMKETSEVTLLKRRKRQIRQPDRKQSSVQSKIERVPGNFSALRHKYVQKPPLMMIQEPILFVVMLHNALAYSLLYLILFAFPYTFGTVRHLGFVHSSLPFLGMGGGIIMSCLAIMVFNRVWWLPLFLKKGTDLAPEYRLPPFMAGAILCPAAIFWFAWTSDPTDVASPVPAALAGVFIGAGIAAIYLPSYTYIVDVYLLHANSALAGVTGVRSLLSFALSLAATSMYQHLGVGWGNTLIGFAFLVLAPFPFALWCYGEKVRSWSKYLPEHPVVEPAGTDMIELPLHSPLQ